MRKMVIWGSALLAGAVLATAVLLLWPGRAQMWLYPLVRQTAQAKMNYETRSLTVYETAHFTVKYDRQDADVVQMVAQAAEKAYQPVTDALGYSPAGKTLILMYPNRQELNQAFGWSGDQSAMGVYWGGVIQILSPHVWLKDTSPEEFIRTGPMVHEFTHLVFDHMTEGNYPRWFTEGLAQYVEYKVNDYEWRSPSNSLGGKLYTMAELDANFDALPDQSLAYRESLAAVRYIAEVYGDGKLRQVIGALQAGKNLQAAIGDSLGLDYDAFAADWEKWAAATMH
ncbi:MAG: peptidase MA family metallohydrolase [Negativicutes bacterium]|nr:peptidase MA family metallohydrolase [Negativicutes bacterium]